jgi:hypothetical protein
VCPLQASRSRCRLVRVDFFVGAAVADGVGVVAELWVVRVGVVGGSWVAVVGDWVACFEWEMVAVLGGVGDEFERLDESLLCEQGIRGRRALGRPVRCRNVLLTYHHNGEH